MITIYKTKTMKDASEYVMNRLKRIDSKALSVMHTIIVPDRASLEAERQLLKTVGGSFNIQVKTFRRLAADILPKYNYLSKQAGIMALSGIIRDNKDKLTCFTKGTETAGFVEDMYNTISMMKYCKITPDALKNGDFSRSVSGKAKDIAVLYRAYLDFTKDRFIDSADKLDLLREAIHNSHVAQNGYFYLYDFDNLSAQELAIIEQLAKASNEVIIACCVSYKSKDKYLYLNDIYQSIVGMCKRCGINWRELPENGIAEGESSKYIKHIGDKLYRYGQSEPIENDDFIELFQGATRAQEVYALACRAKKYAQNGGRYKDIYVVTSDVSSYSNAIDVIFSQFDIPYFCDKQFILSEHPYVRFILDYVTIYRNNGKLSAVLPFVKNYLFCNAFDDGSGGDEVYAFENYCLKYNVSYRYDDFTLGCDEPYFEQAEVFRAKFNCLFKQVVFPASAKVSEYVQIIRNLIEISDLKKKNEIFCLQQREKQSVYESDVTSQVCDKFESVLVNAENIVGNRFVTLDEFIKTLTAGVSSVKISVIPARNDCVVFANMAKARKHDVKFLVLLGANYGAMPIIKRDCNLLTDNNIKDLISAGINVEPQILTENRRERFSLFQLLQEPTVKLYVSYSASDGSDRLSPSPFVNELKKLFVSKGASICEFDKIDEEVYSENQAIAKAVLNNRRLLDRQTVLMPSFDILRQEYAEQVERYTFNKDRDVTVQRGGELYLKNAATSVSQLTDFFKCPYRFYIQYGLNVKPRPVSQLQSADLGNILHAVLEQYVRDMDEKESDAVTAVKADKWFDFAMSDDFYKGMRNDPQMAGTLDMLRSESRRMCQVVKEQFINSTFKNLATELGFGGANELPAVEVSFDGGKFSLVGKIDRVDVNGDTFIVIDYKSGASAAHFSEKDLFVGHKMQLPVYVKAVKDNYKMRPAGFYYFNMHNNFTDIDAESVYVYNGRTLDDVDVVKNIDTTLVQYGKSEKLGLKLNIDGSISKTGGKLLTEEQFDNQIEYAFKLIQNAGNLMRQGYASVNPYKGACSYCDYKDVCDFGDIYTNNEREVKSRKLKETIDNTVKK